MDQLQFADDSALTPISELRQAAKARARETGQNLSSALDEIAQTLSYPRWDALLAACWTVHPANTEENPASAPLVSRRASGRQIDILIDDLGDEKQDLCLAVHDWQEGDTLRRRLHATASLRAGRVLDLSDDERKVLADAETFQARVRAVVPIALSHASHVPLLVGRPMHRRERDAAGNSAKVPATSDTVKIVVEIPGLSDHFEATLDIGESRESLVGWLRTEDTPGLYDFRVQKDGCVLARRAKFGSEEAAGTALKEAIKVLSFLSWTGLKYPNGRESDRAHDDQLGMGETGLFDHRRTLMDRKSGATVVLNQPYDQNREIHAKGMLNLLKPGTITSEAAVFAGLHEGTRVLFHSLEGQGADLEAIAIGALHAEMMTRQAKIIRVGQETARKKSSVQKKPGKAEVLSPVADLVLDLNDIPLNEKILLSEMLPSATKLQTPYWRGKMKAFVGREHLSWSLQDKYRAEGISQVDVVVALRSCPLDADLWGLFGIFDLAEVTKAECFRRGVIAGELYLGRDTFEQEAGDFWQVLETRPYMRAMYFLYCSLVKMHRPAEALPLGRKMLELNRSDNMGIRFSIDEVEAAAENATLAAELAEAFEAEAVAAE